MKCQQDSAPVETVTSGWQIEGTCSGGWDLLDPESRLPDLASRNENRVSLIGKDAQ